MLDLLLYATLNCQDSDAIMLRIARHESLPPQVKVELVETVGKQPMLSVTGTQTTEGTGKRILRKQRRLTFHSIQVTTNEHPTTNQEADR